MHTTRRIFSMRIFASGLIILFILSGCSTLQTNVRSNIDWARYRHVEVSVTEPDRWELRPLVAEQLAGWGLVPVEHNQQTADLSATLEVTEGTGIAETGEETTWPKTLLLRLYDRSSGAELARSRYQLAPTQNPKHGLALMVKDLRKQAGKAMTTTPQPTDQHTAIAPVQTTPAPATDSIAPTKPSSPMATPGHNEPGEPESTNSDWVPRFKGWQSWGNDTTSGETY
jgi:hypothetical protein